MSLTQTELRAANNHIDLVGNPVADKAVNRQGSRNTVDQRKHVRREVFLQGGALVQVVQNNLGNCITLEDNDQSLTGTARSFIANICNTLDLTVTNQLSNLVSQVVGVDLIGKLSDHQALASVDFLHVDNRALGDGTASRTVCVFNSTASQNGCARWEVGTGDQLEEGLKEFLSRGLGVLKRPLHAARNLT